jgi:hypothetical protein
MISRSVRASSIRLNRRLDPKYFLSAGTQAAERMAVAAAAGAQLITIGGKNGLGDVTAPGRFKRAYAAKGEDGIPYLRPYDVFDYVPIAADYLSPSRSDNIAELMAPPGALLQTCSGRNLGPALAVDAHLERFALSHDLIRIMIENEAERHYVLAFLATTTGQALVRRDKTGSVIDHLSVSHIADVSVPFFEDGIRHEAADKMGRAVRLREEARVNLANIVDTLQNDLPSIDRQEERRRGWSVSARTIGTRIDAAFHDPTLARVQQDLLDMGGQTLDEVAEVRKPGGRYKTFYVDSSHGRPLLSGRQVLQYWPVNLQYISLRSLDPSRYELHKSWIAFQADGRSEERLGVPVLIEPGRNEWLASGHVGRFIPRQGVDAGWLYAACATQQVQLQIKALACGSVVDALYEDDLKQVVLPPPGGVDGKAVMTSWRKFTWASEVQAEAESCIEGELDRLTGVSQISA